jgi:MYXO-CTERM domain-containing protein
MGLTVGLTTALPASAGVDACGDIRFDGLANCEVRLTAECSASCSEFGIYKTACATKLVPVCSTGCSLSATPTCTDSCTDSCQTDCDNGVNVICAHNCFAECTTNRDVKCSAATNGAQCAATWDANCDSECDAQCVTVDGGCYQHCVECCHGSCTADANMDCQTTCQDQVFEECEQEFRANCDASCSGDGSLFCDGTYIISGSQIPACIDALLAEGITVKAEGKVTIGPDGINGDVAAGLCAFSPGNKGSVAAPFAMLAAAAGWLARRRKRSSRSSRS